MVSRIDDWARDIVEAGYEESKIVLTDKLQVKPSEHPLPKLEALIGALKPWSTVEGFEYLQVLKTTGRKIGFTLAPLFLTAEDFAKALRSDGLIPFTELHASSLTDLSERNKGKRWTWAFGDISNEKSELITGDEADLFALIRKFRERHATDNLGWMNPTANVVRNLIEPPQPDNPIQTLMPSIIVAGNGTEHSITSRLSGNAEEGLLFTHCFNTALPNNGNLAIKTSFTGIL